MRIFLTAALACTLLVLQSEASAETNYQLLCRGPLPYATGTGGGTMVVFLQKAATSSGNGGVSLGSGTCAWTDRPLRTNEPTKIYFDPETSATVRPSFVAFTACAGDSKCVVEFMAHNANSSSDPHFRIDDAYIRIWHPFP